MASWRRSRVWWLLRVLLVSAAALGLSIIGGRVIQSPTELRGDVVGAGAPRPALQAAKTPARLPVPKAKTLLSREPETFSPPHPEPSRVVAARYSGSVLFVNPEGRTLVLWGMDASSEMRQVTTELASDARILLSHPDDQPDDPKRNDYQPV